MSGDVQPRKRKDKKKKKDDLGIEEPRGTAAVFGEGDVFMHSHHEHGTGGHWCAKIIFFSLLAVLIGLIGLIILENRGLTDLEANQVESRYSGVLEGWLEDAPDDDHHDEHTLELKHHDDDDDEDDHANALEHDDEEEHNDDDNEEDQQIEDDDEEDRHGDDEDDDDDEDQHDDDDEEDQPDDDEEEDQPDDDEEEDGDDVDDTANDVDDDAQNDHDEDEIEDNQDENENNDEQTNDNDDDDDEKDDDDSAEKDNDEENDAEDNIDSAEDEDEIEPVVTKRYKRYAYLENDDDDDDDLPNDDNDFNDDSDEQNDDPEDEEEHEEEPEVDTEVEVEHIEKEVTDDDVFSRQKRSALEDDSEEISTEASPVDVDEDDDVEFLEPDELDDELPEVLPIPVPKGKPLTEVEDTLSSERPHDTLAEEEEYEREQEALKKAKEQSSQGLWLKLTVGGALLVATHAVLRRFTAPREPEESDSREETPVGDRRIVLNPEPSPTVAPVISEVKQPIIQKEAVKQVPIVAKPPQPEEESEEEEDEEVVIIKSAKPLGTVKNIIDKELYSDEEEEDVIEEEEPKVIPKTAPIIKQAPVFKPPSPVKEPSPEIEEDVEIIDDEELEEEMEEEGDGEDDISDVDDVELLTRLEAKYGRLPMPEPERPGRKDGGNSIEDMWPGEPSDPYWRDQLDEAEQDVRQGEWSSAEKRTNVPELRSSGRARFITAKALDAMAEAKRDNQLLTKAIAAYLELLKMNERLSDKKLLEVTSRTLERIKFRGNYLSAEPIYRLLIRRFPNDVNYRNNLTVSFLMANRVDLAEDVLKETLTQWPDDKVALAHYGFVLKTQHNKLEEAVVMFTKALEGDSGPACEPRFYYHLGDALLLLGRFAEAHEVHKRGATHGHFLSPAQRSLYNVDRLRGRPWWNIADTPYTKLAKALEQSWQVILKEGEAAKKLYENEKEGLREKGEWSQLDLFVRGREVPNRCLRAPVTCAIIKSEVGASGCRRGQVKFSAMEAGTHVRPHVGPTNCRLRMHLGLSNTKDTFIRVDQEIRQWQAGKVLMFDDSFEHEVWHNGTGTRLVLIVDVWHPDLTPKERNQLPAI